MKVIGMDRLASESSSRKLDADLLAKAMRQSSQSLYATLLRIVRNEDDAEDLLHDTYLRALGRLRSYRGEGNVEAWLRKIAVRLALNHLRARRIRRWIPLVAPGSGEEGIPEPPADLPAADEASSDAQQRRRVELLLADLSPKMRSAFALRVLDQRPYSEIAGLLSCSESSARSLCSRARAKLETEIKRRGWHDEQA